MSLQPFFNLLQEFKDKITRLKSRDETKLKESFAAIQLSAKYLRKLSDIVVNQGFQYRKEEVVFFKIIKPQIFSVAIFYNELAAIESIKARSNLTHFRKFLKKRSYKIMNFFQDNNFLYVYYQCRLDQLDEELFLRSDKNILIYCLNQHSIVDIWFATGWDILMAKIMAYEELQLYLNAEIKRLDSPDSSENEPKHPKSVFKWTETKVAFTELIYALRDSKAIDDGKVDINDLAKILGEIFNISPGDIYHTFAEIKYRKKSTTNFIDKLRDALSKRAFGS